MITDTQKHIEMIISEMPVVAEKIIGMPRLSGDKKTSVQIAKWIQRESDRRENELSDDELDALDESNEKLIRELRLVSIKFQDETGATL